MKKLLIPTVIIILVTFFISACDIKETTLTSGQNMGMLTPTGGLIADPIMIGENAPSVDESLAKISSKLKEEPAFRSCIARSTQMCGSEVISKFAQEKDSDSACDVFDDASLKTSCINAINIELAKKKSDISFCANLDISSKTNCEQQMIIAQAMKEKDIRICAKLKTPKKDDSSFNSGEILSTMIIDWSDQCILQVIMMSSSTTEINLKTCDMIINGMIKQNCISMMKSRIDMQKNIPVTLPITTPVVPINPLKTGTGLND